MAIGQKCTILEHFRHTHRLAKTKFNTFWAVTEVMAF
jgi:hypothetical protein